MRVFESELTMSSSGELDATKLFEDAKKRVDEDIEYLEGIARDNGLNFKPTTRLGRGHVCQTLINRTSGGYFAPTTIKGYLNCPANFVVNTVTPRQVYSAKSLGSVFHEVMEDLFKGSDRSESTIWKLLDEKVGSAGIDRNSREYNQLRGMVQSYIDVYDYSGLKKENRDSINCTTEQFFRVDASPLGVDLPGKICCLVDRIDLQDDGTVIIVDYKTSSWGGGAGDMMNDIDGYLPQMIFYKWVVEEYTGAEVSHVYLCSVTPESAQYEECDVSSLVNQSKVVDLIFKFHEQIKEAKESRVYEARKMRYCGSCPLNSICPVQGNLDSGTATHKVLIEVPLHFDMIKLLDKDGKELPIEEVDRLSQRLLVEDVDPNYRAG